jgi:type VI secretion system protein ImpA
MNDLSSAESPAAAPPPEAAPHPFALPRVSPDDPCGPDLDLEGDQEFLNFVAATEGQLPASYYDFKRDAIDFAAAFAAIDKLLKRTLDVRLIVLAAKLSILNRDVASFAGWIGSLKWVLCEYWEGVHPRAEGDDYSVRLGQLMALEDNAVVLLPLQYARLLEIPREGSFAYRDQLAATGAVLPRTITRFNERTGEKETSADEKFVPQKTIDKILRDVEIEKLAALFEALGGLAASLESIKATTTERVGYEKMVELPKLVKLVQDMTEFVRAALFARDPSLAPPPAMDLEADAAGEPAAAAAGPPPAFASRAEVDAALASALGYFEANEPSSPALLLIRQARETLGKNLYEVMKLLTPPHADNARVFVGPDSAFTVPVKSLSSAPTAETPRAPSEPASSRPAALALIDAVAAHMQRTEPSSPAPYLLERARSLASRDFISLLSDLLPDDAIASLKKGR